MIEQRAGYLAARLAGLGELDLKDKGRNKPGREAAIDKTVLKHHAAICVKGSCATRNPSMPSVRKAASKLSSAAVRKALDTKNPPTANAPMVQIAAAAIRRAASELSREKVLRPRAKIFEEL